jgi:hypothetical protein
LRLGRGVDLGQQPYRLWRQLDNLAGKHGEAELVGVCGRQGDPDADDDFGHARGDLDQAEADRVKLGLAPERSAGRQTAQGQHQPIRGGVRSAACSASSSYRG